MATTKQMQDRAKARKFAEKLKAQGPIKHTWNTTNVGNGLGAMSMTAQGEAIKALNLVKSDRAPCAMRSNMDDLQKFTNFLFPENDAGFFVAVLPCNEDGNVKAVSLEAAAQCRANFQSQRLTKDHVLFSTYCTWDYAVKHFYQVCDTYYFAVIAFSTPQHLQTLAEDPACY